MIDLHTHYFCKEHGIVLRFDNEDAAQPWVTHQINAPHLVESGRYAGGYYWGHYFCNPEDAIIDFIKRAQLTESCDVEPVEDAVHRFIASRASADAHPRA